LFLTPGFVSLAEYLFRTLLKRATMCLSPSTGVGEGRDTIEEKTLRLVSEAQKNCIWSALSNVNLARSKKGGEVLHYDRGLITIIHKKLINVPFHSKEVVIR
jgi:hypothetical protein